MGRDDFHLLLSCQRSLMTLHKLQNEKKEIADVLADVWNNLLDCRGLLLQKILDDPVMQHAGLEQDLLMLLKKRAKEPVGWFNDVQLVSSQNS